MKKVIETDRNTCQICGEYADWDTSYGPQEYIVCHHCMNVLTDNRDTQKFITVMDILFKMGEIRKEEI